MRRFRNSSQKRYLGSTDAGERVFLPSDHAMNLIPRGFWFLGKRQGRKKIRWSCLTLVRIQTVTCCCTTILPLNSDIYCTNPPSGISTECAAASLLSFNFCNAGAFKHGIATRSFRIEASKKDISDLLHFPRFATWGTLAGRVVIVQNPMFQTLTVVTVVLVETLAPKQANNIIHQYATHLLGKIFRCLLCILDLIWGFKIALVDTTMAQSVPVWFTNSTSTK